jgi:tetratricopeptide (TPR) repeat protein
MTIWTSFKNGTRPARAWLKRRWAPTAAVAAVVATTLGVITDMEGLVNGGGALSQAEAASLALSVASHLEAASVASGGEIDGNTDLERTLNTLARSGDRNVERALTDLDNGNTDAAFSALEDSARQLERRQPQAAAERWFAVGVLAEAVVPERAMAAYQSSLTLAPDSPRTLDRLGGLYLDQGDDEQAEALHRRALEAAIEAGDELEQARIHSSLGSLAWMRGDFDDAEEFYDRALELADLNGDVFLSARQLGNLGLIAMARGETETAEAYYDRAYNLMEQSGDATGMALARNNLANIYRQRGELDRAEDMYRLTLSELETAGQPQLAAMTIASLGMVAESRGDYQFASRFYERSLERAREYQYIRAIERAARSAGWMAMQHGDLGQARQYADEALAAAERIPDPANLADVLILSVGIAASAEDDALARAHAARVFEIIDARGAPPDTRAYIHDALALSAFFAEDYTRAEQHVSEARRYYQEAGEIPAVAEQELRLATLAFRRDEREEGCNWLEAAEVNYGRSGVISEANRMLDRREEEGCPPREIGGNGNVADAPG